MIDVIKSLSPARWEAARRKARDAIKTNLVEPDQRDYTASNYGALPRIAIIFMAAALVIVGGASFVISAGKQVVASDMVLAPLVNTYSNRLSHAWGDGSIVALLLLGEVGAILFMAGAGIFPGEAQRVYIGRRLLMVKPIALAFRSAALMCAFFALLSNVTINSLRLQEIQTHWVFAWFVTLAPPLTVLFIGLFLERMLLGALEERSKARNAYAKARSEFDLYNRDPERHPDFRRTWHLAIIEELKQTSPLNRTTIEKLAAENVAVLKLLIQREFNAHQWADFDPGAEQPENPTERSAEQSLGLSQPALISLPSASGNGSKG